MDRPLRNPELLYDGWCSCEDLLLANVGTSGSKVTILNMLKISITIETIRSHVKVVMALYKIRRGKIDNAGHWSVARRPFSGIPLVFPLLFQLFLHWDPLFLSILSRSHPEPLWTSGPSLILSI